MSRHTLTPAERAHVTFDALIAAYAAEREARAAYTTARAGADLAAYAEAASRLGIAEQATADAETAHAAARAERNAHPRTRVLVHA